MKKRKYTKEILEKAVLNSTSFAGVCRHLDAKPFTGSQTHISKTILEFNIDTSHFKGKGWNKGGVSTTVKPIEDYLNNKIKISSSKLRKRIILEKLKEHRCEICKLTEWMGNPIPLELDHINSNHFDNTLTNLQIICPNCHSLKPNYRGRKKKKPR